MATLRTRRALAFRVEEQTLLNFLFLAVSVRKIPFTQVDVFTSRAFAGNPLAVFWDAQGLSDDEMQLIAREMNLSETTFVLPPEAKHATYRMRIFTPAQELPYAGHPSVGTAFLLASQGRFKTKPPTTRVFQEVPAGVLPLDIETAADGTITSVWTTQGAPRFYPPERDRVGLAQALGLGEDDLHPTLPPQVVSTGLPWLLTPLRDVAALDRVSPDPRAFRSTGAFHENVYPFVVQSTATGASSTEGRGFPMREFEDPVTGSATGCLGAYLTHHRALKPQGGVVEFVNNQGRHLKRPGQARVRVEVDAQGVPKTVQVGGIAVEVLAGEVFLP